ncbi:MAG: group II intron reverse transcriptase/maturase [Desulfuromonadales bacterium]|nr:group II intron reverse transcriptase/maturase [Desulfuromonadales bacterium]
MAKNMRLKVRSLQGKLSRAAKQSLDRRFGALYDKLYREDVLWTAWQQVRVNRGAPGVDRQTIKHIEEVIGAEAFLAELGEELRYKRYRPQAVRRCWIDKPGKAEKRPLGIPVVKDRVVQMAAKLVLEPIFEANFLDCSCGFRPGRNAHMAIKKIRSAITFGHQTVVIDADIKGYFDAIRHDILMRLVQKRVSDPRLLKLIRGWLTVGVMEEGRHTRSSAGTPQGGVISPLLANLYLHCFDVMFAESGIPGTLVRYADDFVILVHLNGEKVLAKVRGMLGRLGLELHPEKTRIVSADDGFDFLGIHLRRTPTKSPKAKMKYVTRLWPSERSLQRVRDRIKEVISRRYGTNLEEIVQDLNPVIRGWNNYHTAIPPVRQRLLKLNRFVRERLRIFLKRKYSDETRGCRRVSGEMIARLGLCQFG